MEFPLARQRFFQEVNRPEEQIDLSRAALFLAQEEYPELDVEEYLNALDTMAVEVEERLPAQRYPLRIIQTLNTYLFEDLKFSGNADNYYDPRNSFLNDVLDRRVGIPISLSLVYLELAKRIDFPMAGVGMPAHFLVRPVGEELEVFVDPFNRGEVMFPEDCRDRLNQVYGVNVMWQPEFLEPIANRRFLARMLTNLKMIYVNQQEWLKALAAIDRLLLLFPESPAEWRDRGLIYYQLGRWAEATQDLENYLEAMPQGEDVPVIQQLLRRIEEGDTSDFT